MTFIKNKNILVALAFFSIYVIWGTTFLAISYGLKGFPPFLLSGFRFFTAGLILYLFLRIKGEKGNHLSDWKNNGISGILILTVGVGTVAWAEQFITSTEAAILIASEPFWFILLDKKNRSFYLGNKLAVGGLVIGFIGLLLFFKDSLFSGQSMGTLEGTNYRNIAYIALIASALVWVLGSLNSKKATNSSLFMNVSQQLIVGGFACILFASIRGEWSVLAANQIPFEAWAGLLYLIFFGSIIAYMSFIWLLSIKPAALVSTHTFINPLVAVVAGYFIANESITKGQAFAMSIIVLGVVITNMVQYQLSKRTKVKLRKTMRTLGKIQYLRLSLGHASHLSNKRK